MSPGDQTHEIGVQSEMNTDPGNEGESGNVNVLGPVSSEEDSYACLNYDIVKRNGEKYDPDNVRARALPIMATLNELSKRLLFDQPSYDGWREVRPEKDWMTPEIILRTNVVTLHRFISRASPADIE